MGLHRLTLAVVAALSSVAVSWFPDASTTAAASTRATAQLAERAGASSGSKVTGHSCHGVFSGSPRGSLVQTTSAGPNDSTVSPGQAIQVTLTWNPNDLGGNPPAKTEDCVEIGSQISTGLSQEHVPGPTSGTDTFTFVVPLNGTGGQQICDRGAVWAGDDEGTGESRGSGQGNGGGDGGGTGSGQGDGEDAGSGGGPGQAAGQHDAGVSPSVQLRAQNDQGSSGSDDHVEKSSVLCYTLLTAAAPEAPAALLFPLAGLVVCGGAVLVVRRRRARPDSPSEPV